MDFKQITPNPGDVIVIENTDLKNLDSEAFSSLAERHNVSVLVLQKGLTAKHITKEDLEKVGYKFVGIE